MVNVAQVMPTLLTSFMASLVECVEALTVVLAVGTVRGWKFALSGTAGALLTLLLLMLLLGHSLALIPISALQVGIGLLLLLFGLRWLRKAILRASGVIPLHDEEQAFAKESATLQLNLAADRRRFDLIAFVGAYKIVMLEGIEVVFIVIALGSGVGLLVPAAIGAIAAFVFIVLLGIALHRPLARIPENTLKFAVGILLSAFGNYWVGEGIGIAWPGADRSLLALVAAYLGVGCATVMVFRRRSVRATTSRPSPTQPRRNLLARIFAALMSMFIDDSLLALGTVIWVALCALALHWLPLSAVPQASGLTGGLMAILAFSGARGARLFHRPAILTR